MILPFTHSTHSVTQKLSRLMKDKQSNLAVSADVHTAADLLHLAQSIGDNIVVLKTHMDIISDFNLQLTHRLRKLAEKAGFLIFEDRKFADIGTIVKRQLENSIFRITDWADIINAHIFSGHKAINALNSTCLNHDIGLLLVAQMSTSDSFFTSNLLDQSLSIASSGQSSIMGFIAQEKISKNNNLVTVMPGINFDVKNDDFGQSYCTPEHALIERNADILVVGRGIYKHDNPKQIAKQYQTRSWSIYQKSLYNRL